MAIIKKKKKMASVGEDVEKLECLNIVGENVKWCSQCRKLYGSSSKIKHSNSTSGHILKRIENRELNRCLYIHVRSSIIPNSEKGLTTQMSIEGRMDIQNMVYTQI